ncbi:MAG: diguanylate cyclase [Deltaproteobacteria bacterium]|nr:diguanylate cyclase [Deltaproteobacteria bacterium]
MDNRILIVDDKPEVRDSMSDYMRLAGFVAESVASAEDALEVLRTDQFDLVITDIVLPGIGGLELTQLVKKRHNTDVVVMTGYSDNFSYEGAINIGASDFVVKPVRLEELLLRVRRVLRERELTHERNRMMEKLQKLAVTDGLTGLFNSRHFFTQLELEVDRSSRYQHPLALLLIDIDHFKDYNDAFGHLEGDKVLVRFSQILGSCLRANDSAFRYGGEEFTVILPETGAEEARTVAQRIRAAVEAEIFAPHTDRAVSKTISIGVTEYCPSEEMTAFIHRADAAMYLSKQNGRNRVSVLFADNSLAPVNDPAR